MRQRRDWLAGCVVGAWSGFGLVYAPVYGIVLMLAFAIPAVIGRTRLAAIGGLLGASGGMILLILGLANLNCAALYSGNGGGCTPADLTGWLVAGLAMVLAGAVPTIVAMAQWRRT